MDFHPLATHFPLVIVTLVFFLEMFQHIRNEKGVFDRSIVIFLSLGVLMTIASFITGLSAEESAEKLFQLPDDAIAIHYNAARVVLVMMPVILILKYATRVATHNRLVLHIAYLLGLVFTLVTVYAAGYYGGELVFKHGAGVVATDLKVHP